MKRLAIAIASFALGACGSDDPDRALLPVAGCEAFDHTPCDIRDEGCQSRLHGLAACLRGQEAGARPFIRVISEDAYREELGASIEPRPNPDHDERALSLLGLVKAGALDPEAQIDERASSTGGVYRSDTQEIVVIDRDRGQASASAILVHELIHAQQDRQHDLTVFQEAGDGTTEGTLCRRALVEGEAELHVARYAAALTGIDPATADLELRFENAIARLEEELREPGSPLLVGLRGFPYSYGARAVGMIWADGGQEGIVASFSAPPASSRALMTLDPSLAPVEVSPPVPPAEVELVTDDRLGALGLFAALRHDLDLRDDLSAGWRGDRLTVYASASGDPADPTTIVVWRIVFVDDDAATSAEAVFGDDARRDGTLVTIAKATAELDLGWAFD